jgi:signal peptidase I
MNYTGPSMNPTLEVGDGLHVVPYMDQPIRRGDIVVFRRSDQAQFIVHRIVQISEAGIRTRGDNNNLIDPWLLRAEEIVGRAVAINRKGKNRSLAGGKTGLVVAQFLWLRRWLLAGLRARLQPGYRRLAATGLFYGWLKPPPQAVWFHRDHGPEVQLIWRRRLIGRWPAKSATWEIRPPYRLFLDPKLLPQSADRIRAIRRSSNR